MNLVQLIIDPNFCDAQSLGHSCPLWIADSISNRQLLTNTSRLIFPITWFALRPNEQAVDVFARIIESLDQHHNELAQETPYDVLDVYGLPPTADVLSHASELGFVSQVHLPGFVRFLKSSAPESAKPAL